LSPLTNDVCSYLKRVSIYFLTTSISSFRGTMASAILVTGGAGYVGSHTVASILEKETDPDFEIVVVDNLTNAYRAEGQKKPEAIRIIEELTNKRITFYELDLSDKQGLSKIFEKVAVGRLPELMVFGNDYPTVDGTGVRDYIHVEDLAEGHVKAVRHGHRLLSSPNDRSIQDCQWA
ncbi:hypothetical protein HF086_011987, partial [Spodoptera exigua]